MSQMMSLYQKLVELRKHVGCLVKDQEGYGYNYVTGNQILAKVKDKMNELNLVLLPSACVGETFYIHDYTTANGVDKTDFIVMGEMSYTWVNADDPNEKLVVPWAYYGQQDDISKAYGSALTYSERYFWLKMLGLPTDEDDPDSIDTTNKSYSKITTPESQTQEPMQKSSKITAPDAALQTSKDPAHNTPAQDNDSSHEDMKKLFQPKSKRYITQPQQNRLYALANGDKNIVAEILAIHGLSHESKITMGEQYDIICRQTESMAKNKAS